MIKPHPVSVSVIIPNYNHAAFLEQRISSVFEQTYQDFEVIILDDCSTDNSRDIIEQYRSHPKVTHIIFNESNSGSAFKQWKKGFQYCSGNFIWVAESDDWCTPDFLEILLDGFKQQADCTIAFAQSRCVDADGRFQWETKLCNRPVLLDGRDFVKSHMLYQNAIVNASMALFRRDLLGDLPEVYASYYYCGDWLFWIALAIKGSVFIYDKPLNYYRKHDNDVTGRALASGLYIMEEARLIGYLLLENIIEAAEYRVLLLRCYSKLKYSNKRFSKQQLSEIRQSFRSQFRSQFHFILFKSEAGIRKRYRLIRKFFTDALR